MGETAGPTAPRNICRSPLVRTRLQEHFTLQDIPYRSGGPARYVRSRETGGRLGFITPLTHNFCESCNRVRRHLHGTLYMCLGQEDAADLRAPLRAAEFDHLLHAAIDDGHRAPSRRAMTSSSNGGGRPKLSRTMSTTGG